MIYRDILRAGGYRPSYAASFDARRETARAVPYSMRNVTQSNPFVGGGNDRKLEVIQQVEPSLHRIYDIQEYFSATHP